MTDTIKTVILCKQSKKLSTIKGGL